MNRWIVPVAGGGVVVALLARGCAGGDVSGPSPAVAQTPTTVVAPGGRRWPAGRSPSTGWASVSGIPDTALAEPRRERAGTVGGRCHATGQHEGRRPHRHAHGRRRGQGRHPDAVYVSVWPQYRDGSQDVNGYWASNSVNATIHDVSRAGPVHRRCHRSGRRRRHARRHLLLHRRHQRPLRPGPPEGGGRGQAPRHRAGPGRGRLRRGRPVDQRVGPVDALRRLRPRDGASATTVAGAAPTPIEPGLAGAAAAGAGRLRAGRLAI